MTAVCIHAPHVNKTPQCSMQAQTHIDNRDGSTVVLSLVPQKTPGRVYSVFFRLKVDCNKRIQQCQRQCLLQSYHANDIPPSFRSPPSSRAHSLPRYNLPQVLLYLLRVKSVPPRVKRLRIRPGLLSCRLCGTERYAVIAAADS